MLLSRRLFVSFLGASEVSISNRSFAMASSSASCSDPEKIKETAYGICRFRTLLSLLPEEAESLRYDPRTPNFEGIALNQVSRDSTNEWVKGGIEGARKSASDLPAYLKKMESESEVSWGGFQFNVCRAHFVDNLLKDSIKEGCPIRQIVFCGVGMDFRGMRYAREIREHGAKVFELDLGPMIAAREVVKKDIIKANEGLILPETYALTIDYGRQHLSDVLLSCPGFDPKIPTLYLLEGVSYYLTPDSMKHFFQDVYSLICKAPPNERDQSRVFFDHLVDLPRLVAANNDKPAAKMLEVFEKFEPLQAFLDYDQVEPYMKALGYAVVEQLTPPTMYEPFQTARNPDFHMKSSPYFGIVVAKYAD